MFPTKNSKRALVIAAQLLSIEVERSIEKSLSAYDPSIDLSTRCSVRHAMSKTAAAAEKVNLSLLPLRSAA
jgi:hypothetical protein